MYIDNSRKNLRDLEKFFLKILKVCSFFSFFLFSFFSPHSINYQPLSLTPVFYPIVFSETAAAPKKTQRDKVKKIYILPINYSNREFLNSILNKIIPEIEKKFLNYYPCEILSLQQKIEIPEGVFSIPRNQYRVLPLIYTIKNFLPSDGIRLIGITDIDLYEKNFNFLFGLADEGKKTAVISTFRLKTANTAVFEKRLLTEMVHELAHTFGLKHCKLSGACVMRFSNILLDTDMKGSDFCERCRLKLEKKLELELGNSK